MESKLTTNVTILKKTQDKARELLAHCFTMLIYLTEVPGSVEAFRKWQVSWVT